MSISAIGYVEMKSALKEALVELFQERRDLFHDVLKEIIQEISLDDKPTTENFAPEVMPISEFSFDDKFEGNVGTEIQAFHQLHPQLIEQHSGEFVAIHDEVVVDHDTDKLALYQRIHKAYPEQFVLMRRVEKAPEPELYFRSTRFFIPS